MASKPKQIDLAAFLSILDSTNGRDKVSKIIQYGAKVLAAHLVNNPANKPFADQLSKLDKATGSARKLWRLGKHVPFLLKAKDVVVKGSFGPNEFLSLGQNLGMMNYFLFDNIGTCIHTYRLPGLIFYMCLVWLARVGFLVGLDDQKFAKYSFLGWFAGLVCAIVTDLLALAKYLTAQNQSQSPEWHQQQRIKFALNFIKNFGDLCVAMSGAKLATFSEIFIGIAGSASGWIGLYEAWPAAK